MSRIRELLHCVIAGIGLAALAGMAGPVAFAQTVPDQGPGGPILVINSPGTAYGTFYAEVLRNEGFNEFAVASIANVSAATLQSYDVVLLGQMSLSAAQAQMFSSWVNGGGNLIAMRPDSDLAALLGITITGTPVQNGYLLVDTAASSPGYGIVGETIQYFGAADRYLLSGATEVARLFAGASTATSNAAVTVRNVGSSGGQAVAFAYDLATSLVYARQGNPAWQNQERDGLAPIRSDDFYYGNAVTDPQPDWVNLDKAAIPQADEQQRLLAKLIQYVNRDRKPLPQFWYFPRGEKAVVIMTGDDHANNGTEGRFNRYIAASPPNCSVADWECVRGTSYVFPNSLLSNSAAVNFAAQGFEIGLHVNTGCANYTSGSLANNYSQQMALFAATYPGLPPLSTQRHHCIAWTDWATGARVQYQNGMRLDTTYYYWPAGWVQNRPGFMTGSAMPMRFADVDGSLIDVYQAATQMTDESGQAYPYTVDELLDWALGPEGFYGAFTANMHTDVAQIPQDDAIVASALARGVPIVSADQMLRWLDGRNGSSFTSISGNAGVVNFSISKHAAANGLQAYIPLRSATGVVSSITRNGTAVSYATEVIKGVEQAFFPAEAGAYIVTYTPDTTPPAIVSNGPQGGSVNVSRFASVSATFSESVDPATVSAATAELRIAGGALIAATVSYDALQKRVQIIPAAQLPQSSLLTATVKGGASGVRDLSGNPMASDFIWSFTTGAGADCPCGAFSPTDVPANPAESDSSAVELGVKFTVDVDGYIIGVRFYKGAGNTGLHIGSLWHNGGTLMASAPFSAETATGWQQVDFDEPVPVSAGTVYVASYHAPNGHYAATGSYFANSGVDGDPVNLLQSGISGPNGLYRYSSAPTYPTDSYAAANYWVDVVYSNSLPADLTPPTVSTVTPASGAGGVEVAATATARFSEAVDPSTVTGTSFRLTGAGGAVVSASVIYDAATRTATLAPTALLAPATTYTAIVSGGSGGIRDAAGNAMSVDFSWSFTTAEPDLTAPSVVNVSPGIGSTGVSRSLTVQATFSEPVDASSISGAAFVLRTATGATVPAGVSYNPGSQTASLVPASSLASNHSYSATLTGVRDLAGNSMAADYTWDFTTGSSSQYSAWPSGGVPEIASENDSDPIEIGTKFTVDVAGSVTGLRFFKGAGNEGTHVGNLWTDSGQLLASVVFSGETASGWQQANFPAPVPVVPGNVYVVSYHAPFGHYATSPGYFSEQGVNAGPLTLLQDDVSGGNGVYTYSINSAFPDSSYDASNYWVDVLFQISSTDISAPTVTSVSPADGSALVPTTTSVAASFNESVDAGTVNSASFELRNASGELIPAAVYYQPESSSAILAPSSALTAAETYTATVRGGAAGVRDLAGNALDGDFSFTFTTSVTSSQSVWGSGAVPSSPANSDTNSVELGVKFTVDIAGSISGVRFYKGAGNSGVHVGNLWSASGELLARATFAAESATGWQQVSFSSPVQVTPGNVYVASYFAPNGRYAIDSGYFAAAGVESGPINLLQDGVSGGNGVYRYASTTSFPDSSWNASNYWVDVVFVAAAPDTDGPSVVGVVPVQSSTSIPTTTTIRAIFDEPLDPATVNASSFRLRNAAGNIVPAAVSFDAAASVATLVPSGSLSPSQSYSATVVGGSSGVKDLAGNPLAADYQWSFTTSGSQSYTAWNTTTVPPVPAEDDSGAVELGVKFTVDISGAISGLRFYKGPGNTGTHIGNLWTVNGQLLASAVFSSESAGGWQQVDFGSPVPVSPGNVYVASYYAPNGHYASSPAYFSSGGIDAGPVNLLQDGVSGGNGVYRYGAVSGFPADSWNASNYWVDVVFTTSTVDTVPPTISAVMPAIGSFDVSAGSTVIARFSEPVNASTVNASSFALLDANGLPIPAIVSYDAGSATASLDPVDQLTFGASYTARILGGASGIRDTAGNALAADYLWSFSVETEAGTCTAAPNAIVAENCLPGNPPSEWDISGVGDESIQGFATEISVNRGQSVSFKVDTDASAYAIDIYRIGYYNGLGARKIASLLPSAALPQIQPDCLSDPTTGLVDCGNWGVSATWQVPSTATSGVYIARLERTDTGGASHVVFIVRDDSSTSDLLFQTSDTTWQAYNNYGGNSLYTGSPAGRAYKVSYNRPFNTRIVDNGQDWLFNAEYPMIRWLESNGYDVTYTTGVDSDRSGNLLLNHRVFLSVGHDEYWSAGQRQNVEVARNSGVNLAFFSGNEVFWKTRWEPAIDGSGQAYRTLVTYKETHANGLIDPQSPPTWTGTWRDPRFSPPADGGRPENALTGTMFTVNGGTRAITVTAEDGSLRFWRNTSIANLPAGTTATLADSTLGYEWDSDVDNGFRPAGLIRLSHTTATDVEVLQDYGSTYAIGTANHSLTLYRHTSGSLVFGAGTIQWSWGLDGTHDRSTGVADIRMQQATVNLFADMYVQPVTLQPGLFSATASSDLQPPTSSIASPPGGAVVPVGAPVTISGTASDVGGGVVGGIEVSVDGGLTWHPAQGRTNWSYTWTPVSAGAVIVRTRAADDSGNLEIPGSGISLIVN